MNIVVDENIPKLTVEALRRDGHTVTDLRGTPKQARAILRFGRRPKMIVQC
jgi:hypothetical protein